METDDPKLSGKKVDESWKEQVRHEKEGEGAETLHPQKDAPEMKTEDAFSQFLTSLAIQALIHFGEIENPITKSKSQNLDAAREVIDLLILLKQKTEGHLTENETKLFDSILADLQVKFVQLIGQQ